MFKIILTTTQFLKHMCARTHTHTLKKSIFTVVEIWLFDSKLLEYGMQKIKYHTRDFKICYL